MNVPVMPACACPSPRKIIPVYIDGLHCRPTVSTQANLCQLCRPTMLVNIRSDLRRESAACPAACRPRRRRGSRPRRRQDHPGSGPDATLEITGRDRAEGDAYPGSHLGPLVTDGRPEGRPECAQVMTVRRTGSCSTCAAAGTRRIRAARPRPRPARMPQPQYPVPGSGVHAPTGRLVRTGLHPGRAPATARSE